MYIAPLKLSNTMHALPHTCTYSAWFNPEDDEQGYLAEIDQRIEDVTGLTLETAEPLQVG